MAKAIKLPSGNWRCQLYIGTDSKKSIIRKSFTAPTKREAERLANEYAVRHKDDIENLDARRISIGKLIDAYITSKEKEAEVGLCSPATIRGYRCYRKTLFEDIKDIELKDIQKDAIQDWIYSLAKDNKPKTVKNAWSLLRASLILHLPVVSNWKIKIPPMEQKKIVAPTDSSINAYLDYFKNKDKDMYIACLLASFGGLRRSEIVPLTADDISGNCIIINKASVLSDNKQWITKGTKTELSTREVPLPAFVVKELPKKGKLININACTISDRFREAKSKLGIDIRFHDLRHYSASTMHALGIPDIDIMRKHGWSTPTTLNKFYKGSKDDSYAQNILYLNEYYESKRKTK